MIDMENVIKGLECCTDEDIYGCNSCDGCPYHSQHNTVSCVDLVLKDALELLRAQEPRVMTLEEVRTRKICWVEDEDDGMDVRVFPAVYCGDGHRANGTINTIFLADKEWAIDLNDCEWWYDIRDYNVIWRCWTARPTEEQREATPWKS